MLKTVMLKTVKDLQINRASALLYKKLYSPPFWFDSFRIRSDARRGAGARILKPVFSLLVLLGLACWMFACSQNSEKEPNLVVIVFDALRPDHTGAYGYGRPTTPNLDRLAEEAVVFEDVTAPAAFTLPSMATLFTGKDPVAHGVRRHLDPNGIQDRLDERFYTLAERLKDRGYRTGAMVSNSLFLLKFGFDNGFDHFDAGARRNAGPTIDAALNWLHDQPEDQPFFLWIHFIDPHWPYNAPPEFNRPFNHPDNGEYARTLEAFKRKRLRGDQIYFDNQLSPDGVQKATAEYDNEIAYADEQTGRLLRYLKNRAWFDETLIAVASDHGESLGEHDLHFAHSFYLYQEIQQVVLVIKPPGSRQTHRIAHPVRLLDFMPTVWTLLDMPVDPTWEGADLTPLWTGKGPPQTFPDLPVYAESEPRYRTEGGGYRYPFRKRAYLDGNAGKWRMMRSNGYKLIDIPGEGRELYDLNRDPAESRNIVEEQPGVADQLSRLLKQVVDQDRSEAGAVQGEPVQHDWEALEQIKAMGYGN